MTGPMNAAIPPDRASPYAPSAAPGPSPRRPWGAAAIGLVLGLVIAVAVGAVLVATKKLHFGTVADPSAVNTAAVTLPNSLGAYQDYVTANRTVLAKSSMAADKKAVLLARQQANQTKVKGLTIAAYQAAYGGAAVDVHTYADSDLMHTVSAIVIRAHSPGLTFGVVPDPAYLGMAVNQQQVKSFGPVNCRIVQDGTTVAGAPVDPKKDITTACQRSDSGLTVQVVGGPFEGPDGQQTMVTLTNDAWAAVAG